LRTAKHNRPPSAGCGHRSTGLCCAWIQTWLELAFVILVAFSSCYASAVVSVGKYGETTAVRSQVDLASRFYGLDVQSLAVRDRNDSKRVVEALRQSDALAAVVTADTLSDLDQAQVFSALRRPGRENIPLLIVDAYVHDLPASVSKWTGRRVIGCRAPARDSGAWELVISKENEIAYQLAGVTLPLKGTVTCSLELARDSAVRVLGEVSNQVENQPAFVDFFIGRQHVFILAGFAPGGGASVPDSDNLVGTFSNIAPVMMFLRHATGDRAWHTIGHYANLTVDDPWLIEPYGNLDYQALLEEMEKHNFHLTTAFIPWNFDRCQSDVVSLFHRHPDRFSVCVHGNNHDHREFGEYRREPLIRQIANIKQALARMEEFKRSTGIPYDPVMVFPHAVAPAETFGVLKKYNYWATANSQNVPLDSSAPGDPLFILRPETLAFDNFLSLKRHSPGEASVSPTALAVNSYLGNPLLFYEHQEFFHRGISAFNWVADEVNRIEPETQWRSLGYIVQHLYLLRLRRDQDYDVLAFSPNFHLTNPGGRSAIFHVRKPENLTPPIRSLFVDGEPFPYQVSRDEILLDVSLASRQSRRVEIAYVNDLDLANIDVSKKYLWGNIARRLSDFRDLRLSRSTLGRKLTDLYYAYRLDALELVFERWAMLILLPVVLCVLARFVHGWRKSVVQRLEGTVNHRKGLL